MNESTTIDDSTGIVRRTEIAKDLYLVHVAGCCPQTAAIKRQCRETMERIRKAREQCDG